MKINSLPRLIRAFLPVAVLALPLTWQTPALAQSATCTQGSTCVSVGGNNDPMSKEQARQSQQQWDDTHRLRNKVNNRVEKNFDKYDRAEDAKDNCDRSENLNAYWEPNTERCLDRLSGRQINP
ncbi:Protein of uncharacterised function (DUF1283) [Yersinia frederiksenii]|uniref:UPF0482 protein NCTC11470_00499 n=2 Tax=Yersinia frederiksenii TaxID=29484 RepID=A0A380PPG4_YERFR|nr:DUF1283 family protein [Yersinia frederiksenii]ATM95861.1 hypothetical protein CRN75_11125 [Yersinia frederiksenii]EEQ13369.1 hypothetical protein yfred0001_2950 [Yersinia frederiksenii ATCC 33641]KGA44363.1 hypothetical protein DJ58_3069 [Yersinia frederiksenii ATCC 33641]CNC32332.1 Protein of uncharacterised function (DUF1283) [Yersinia frederiksenii]SUP75486.1 Protein of uncharacterised function (DUF1283) [Yersinia frederiksenii]